MSNANSIPAMVAFGFAAAATIMLMVWLAINSIVPAQKKEPCEAHFKNEQRHHLCIKRVHAELVAKGL